MAFVNEIVRTQGASLWLSLTPGFSRVFVGNTDFKTVSTVSSFAQTVKTVFDLIYNFFTPLKRGVNEMTCSQEGANG